MSNGSITPSSGIRDLKEEIARTRSLAAALFEVRNRQASRDDVVVDMKEAEQARLELLADEVRPYFDDLAQGNEQFEFALTNGKPPRLWIDMTAHVSMGRDRRTYRFLKDTNAGRIILAESHDMGVVADAVGNYMAERVLEHERVMEGDWISLRLSEERSVETERSRKSAALQSAFWFVLGFGVSALALYLWTRFGVSVKS